MVSQFLCPRSTTLIFTSSSNFDDDRFSQTSTWCSHDFHVSSNFAGLSLISTCNTRLAASRSPTLGFRRVLGHQLSPRLIPVSVRRSLHQSQASSSGQCRQRGVKCVTQRSDGHCKFFCSCWKVRHCLRLCVLQKRYVLLIHQSEVVLELETELEPTLLIVVVLNKFRSKLPDFCHVRPSSHHNSANLLSLIKRP